MQQYVLLSIAPLPINELVNQLPKDVPIVVVEEVCGGSGICEELGRELSAQKTGNFVTGMDLGKRFIPHGDMDTLYQYCGLDSQSIADFIQEVLKVEN